MRFLFLFFIVVPIVEMLLLFEVAEHIGGLATVGLVVLTAAIGIQVLKRQGWSTLRRANARLYAGELPAREMLEGIFLAVGGAFLLTPGFITDTLGFLCLIGPTRRRLVDWLIRTGKLSIYTVSGGTGGFGAEGRHGGGGQPGDGRGVYEGEYTRETPPRDRLRDGDRERD